jgi:hypothetical protein
MPAAAGANTSLACEPGANASGRASGRRQTARTPLGPSSAASRRVKPSMAAQATPKPRMPGPAMRAPGVDTLRYTPVPRGVMCRATARAARKWARV